MLQGAQRVGHLCEADEDGLAIEREGLIVAVDCRAALEPQGTAVEDRGGQRGPNGQGVNAGFFRTGVRPVASVIIAVVSGVTLAVPAARAGCSTATWAGSWRSGA